MKVETRTEIIHTGVITSDVKKDDGGRALLVEAFTAIRKHKQVGQLTAHFGPGGTLTNLVFVETEDADIEQEEE